MRLPPMKVGTRLTLMMLLWLAPITLAYFCVNVRLAGALFSEEIKAETRIAQRALNASLTPDVEQREWDEVRYILSEMGGENLVAALLDEQAKLRFASSSFPIKPPPLQWITQQIKGSGAAEFMSQSQGRQWFCRIEVLGSGG